MEEKEWFSSWFDTPFYHILYKHRNDDEARYFISNLVEFIEPEKDVQFLDLACGKGRHSIFLNSLGYQVDGCDLSSNSIEEAKKSESGGLRFYVHDMRESTSNKYDIVLNLFTSIGFFEDPNDNQKMFDSVYSDLNQGGYFIIDFLNSVHVVNNLVPESLVSNEGIDFHIHKKIENNFVVKNIEFSHENKDYSFYERVELISFADFQKLGSIAGFDLVNTFGDYGLNPYTEDSERLILIFKKK